MKLRYLCLLVICLFTLHRAFGATSSQENSSDRFQKRWLFVWRDMSKPDEVERMIARFPQAATAGYNGVVFSYNVAPEKAAKLREAAKQNHMDLVAIVMGN